MNDRVRGKMRSKQPHGTRISCDSESQLQGEVERAGARWWPRIPYTDWEMKQTGGAAPAYTRLLTTAGLSDVTQDIPIQIKERARGQL